MPKGNSFNPKWAVYMLALRFRLLRVGRLVATLADAQITAPTGAAVDDGRLDQDDQLALLRDPVLALEQVADDRNIPGHRHLRTFARRGLAHQAADGDDLAGLATHHAVGLGGIARRQGQVQ